jgi:hypothetical protein
MKPRDVMACFFAAYGVYLIFTGLFGAVGAAAAILAMYRGLHGSIRGIVLAQYLFAILPTLIGLLLVALAPKLAAVATRISGLEEGTTWNLPLSQHTLLAILLAVLGAYLVVTQVPELVRVALLVFMTKAGGAAVAETAARRLPDGSQLIVHLLCAGGGAFLASKCSAVASKLMPEEKHD